MHEFSLARTLWDQIDRLRCAHNAARVVEVRLGVGELAGVEPELLRSAFDLLMESSNLYSVQLHLEQIALEARCEECHREFLVHRFKFECPMCGGNRINVLRGDGLILQQVTLESTENADD
jgi:hydrogenase nickel incorporation protein HypA/HybF